MKMPGFTAEASLYQAINHYRSPAGGSFLVNGNTTITPQACGWVKGGVCGTFIAGGTVLCVSACLGGPAACALCWAGFLGGLYGFCRDCIPGWMRALIDAFESGGSGGGGGGGSGGGGPRPIGCEVDEKCCERDADRNCVLCIPHNAACP